jgi:signal transduction histidine kinase
VVRDHGCGIAKEHLGKIFDPYFTTKQKGSGLGLAAAYSIIKKHNGYITVESEFGKGLYFMCICLLLTKKQRKPICQPYFVIGQFLRHGSS